MTRAEFNVLLQKPLDALTSQDVEQMMNYIRPMLDATLDYSDRLEPEYHPVYADTTTTSDAVIHRSLIGYIIP